MRCTPYCRACTLYVTVIHDSRRHTRHDPTQPCDVVVESNKRLPVHMPGCHLRPWLLAPRVRCALAIILSTRFKIILNVQRRISYRANEFGRQRDSRKCQLAPCFHTWLWVANHLFGGQWPPGLALALLALLAWTACSWRSVAQQDLPALTTAIHY